MSIPHRRPRGFTLIELMVVIGIISILIAVTVVVVAKVQSSARGASTQAQLTTIGNAIQQYYADFHAYPGPLANNQLGGFNQIGGPITPGILDPAGSGAFLTLQYYDPVAKSVANFPGTSETQHITGAENLVLGLLGGLQLQAGTPIQFVYNPAAIFSDVPTNSTPSAQGALSLNYTRPKRTPAYLQVRPGDISHPNIGTSNGQFTDEAGRAATDSIIPEFVDQYSDALPILYLRANAGGTAILSVGGGAAAGGAQLTDSTGANVTAQYDLAQVLDYTTSMIGTNAVKTNLKAHGLEGLGTDAPMTDAIANPATSSAAINTNDGLAYFKDPSNPGTSNTPNITNHTQGNARQKDGYILISPGPDRIYGTADDIIYPGSLQP
jgi:prepilin-type N-terminal cleavage/methylation domain-containing protein